MAKLAKEFVCVRILNMEGVDLDLFRFDYDLTFAILFLDGNDRIYSRYGGRDAGPADARLSKESLLHSMREVLELHRKEWKGPDERDSRPEPKVTIETLPRMARRISKGKAPECFHCHMVTDSRRQLEIEEGKFDKRDIWDYPLPENIGLSVDRDRGAVIESIQPNSPASSARLVAGDRIISADGVPTISEADLRWAFHHLEGRKLELEFMRGEERKRAKLRLPRGWRKSDISWRESMYHIPPDPGFWAPDLDAEARGKLGLPDDVLALGVKWVPAGPARRAGLRNEMVIVEVDGSRKRQTPQQIQLYIRVQKNAGDTLRMKVLKDGREREILLRL